MYVNDWTKLLQLVATYGVLTVIAGREWGLMHAGAAWVLLRIAALSRER
jgi:hypothetical protein